jgi:2-dehydro-3-deoxygalactonokinase
VTEPWFLSCDWGTTSFRLRLVSCEETPEVVSKFASERGIGSFRRGGTELFEAYLYEGIGELDVPHFAQITTLPVVISGMASSSIGWRDVPYARLPFCVTNSDDLVWEKLTLTARDQIYPVYLLSGVCSQNDIMRGEESELLGLFVDPGLREVANEKCVVILPGTHSKHVIIEKGAVVDFVTLMTGELFDVLANHSVLRNSVDWSVLQQQGKKPLVGEALQSFEAGLEASRDSGVVPNLFHVRTRTVLGEVDAEPNTWYLLGVLLGAEMATLVDKQVGSHIVLAAKPEFQWSYRRALEFLGIKPIDAPFETVESSTVLAHAAFLADQGAI